MAAGGRHEKIMKTSVRTNAGQVMPLLMNFTPFTRIEEADNVKMSYNDLLQIIEYDARSIGTKSLKSSCTKTGRQTSTRDDKNVIDDRKEV